MVAVMNGCTTWQELILRPLRLHGQLSCTGYLDIEHLPVNNSYIYQFCAFFVVVSLKCASVPHPFWKGRFIIVHTYGRYKLYTSTEFFVVLFCFLNCFLSSLSFFLHYTRQHMHARTSHFFTQQIRTLYLEISRVYFCLIGCLFLSLEKPLGSDSKPALSSRLE